MILATKISSRRRKEEMKSGKKMAWALVTMAGLLAPAMAQGAGVTILNPSFELNPIFDPPETPVAFALPGARDWTTHGTFLLDDGNGNLTNASVVTFKNTAVGQLDHITNATGAQLASVVGQTGSGITQFLSTFFATGATYVLNFDLGVSHTFPPLLFTQAGGVDPSGDLLFSASLFFDDNGTNVTVGAPIVIDFFTLFGAAGGHPDTLLTTQTLVVNAGDIGAAAGHPIGVSLIALGDGVEGNDALEGGFWNLDNVTLDVAIPTVPEPATLSLTALGALALLRRRR
jgi:hypothetical protein